ncbi:MAG: hypothetical protein M0018_08985, partial [Nitrospiraceae bacterium]|nr:hypothetical protein [Nitrospiraceae bacterium]
FHQLNYEGTPGLWYMMLHIFARLGLPFFSEQVLNWAIAAAAVFIFLKHAPFSRLLKFAFAFSYLMSYEYAVIARNYSISVLLLFAIAAIYGSRFKRPLIFAALVFLLFNTNVHSFVPAAMLLFIFVYELFKIRLIENRKKCYAAVIIMILGALVCIWQLLPAPGNTLSGLGGVPNFSNIPVILKGPFFPNFQLVKIKPLQSLLVPASIFILLMGIFALRPRILLINFLISIIWLFYIFIVKQFGYFGPMHQGLILVLLLFNLWLGIYYGPAEEGKPPVIRKAALSLITAALLSSFLISYEFHILDYRLPFSEGKQMAEFMKKSGAAGYTIIADRPGACVTPLAYLTPGKRFWFAATQEYGSFIGNHANPDLYLPLSNGQLIARIAKFFPGRRDYFLLLSYPLSPPYSADYVLLKSYTNAFWFFGEDYFLYTPRSK